MNAVGTNYARSYASIAIVVALMRHFIAAGTLTKDQAAHILDHAEGSIAGAGTSVRTDAAVQLIADAVRQMLDLPRRKKPLARQRRQRATQGVAPAA